MSEVYLYLQAQTNGSTKYVEVHIITIQESGNYRCALSEDFGNKPTRFFDAWNPLMRFYDNEKDYVFGYTDIQYGDLGYVTQTKAEKMLKTLRSLNKAMEKVGGFKNANYVKQIISFGQVCGVKGIAINKPGGLLIVDTEDPLRFQQVIKQYFKDSFGYN